MKFSKTALPAFTVAALLALLPIGPTTVHAGGPAASASVDKPRVSIGNFGRLNANYYRGEQPEGRDYGALASLGIKTVIDLQADGDNANEASLVEAAGMTFHRIPMTTHVPPTAEQLAEFLAIVTDTAQQPVYVHCAGGKHRTGVMTAVYRMELDGWTADRAFQEMKQYKFGATFLHPEFKEFVYTYGARRNAVAQASVTR
ncbi:MAG: tyrosine-protein phosphatase [Vicinamibacterales bacterium]